MEIVFIRHGEPDKTEVDKRGFIGQGRDLAPLTELGVEQAEKVSSDPLLKGAQVIVSSPYTRALQTAAIISKNNAIIHIDKIEDMEGNNLIDCKVPKQVVYIYTDVSLKKLELLRRKK